METLEPDYGIGTPLSNLAKFQGLKRLVVLLALLLVTAPLMAVDFLAEGEKQLGLNNSKKAITFLEAALAQGKPNERLYLELGLAYESQGMSDSAQKAFQAGADLLGPARGDFLFNLGVARARAKDFSGAEKAYTTLISESPKRDDAILNRANVRIELKDFDHSVEDYRTYQLLLPANAQKDKIDQLILLLEEASLENQALLLTSQTSLKRETDAPANVASPAAASTTQGNSSASAPSDQQRQAAGSESAKTATQQQGQVAAADSPKGAMANQVQATGEQSSATTTQQQAQAPTATPVQEAQSVQGAQPVQVAQPGQGAQPGQDSTKSAGQQQGPTPGADAPKTATQQQGQTPTPDSTKGATANQVQATGAQSPATSTQQQAQAPTAGYPTATPVQVAQPVQAAQPGQDSKVAGQQQGPTPGTDSPKTATQQQGQTPTPDSTKGATASQAKQDSGAKIRETLVDASQDAKVLSTGPAAVKSNDGDFSLDP